MKMGKGGSQNNNFILDIFQYYAVQSPVSFMLLLALSLCVTGGYTNYLVFVCVHVCLSVKNYGLAVTHCQGAR